MSKKTSYQSDEDNIRYKLNTQYFNNARKSNSKSPPQDAKKKQKPKSDDDHNIRYKLPDARVNINRLDLKPKSKPKIKVNFWSNKQSVPRLHKEKEKKSNRRHTVGSTTGLQASDLKPKHSVVKVRKRVSFLPTPIFSDNHVPMVTVPDDLTINLNEEEANELREDLNSVCVTNGAETSPSPRGPRSNPQLSPRGTKRRHSPDDCRHHNNETELEFFSKYVVQKLRKMETNQRIYSENIINTALMLGQLGKLNGKSRIAE